MTHTVEDMSSADFKDGLTSMIEGIIQMSRTLGKTDRQIAETISGMFTETIDQFAKEVGPLQRPDPRWASS